MASSQEEVRDRVAHAALVSGWFHLQQALRQLDPKRAIPAKNDSVEHPSHIEAFIGQELAIVVVKEIGLAGMWRRWNT